MNQLKKCIKKTIANKNFMETLNVLEELEVSVTKAFKEHFRKINDNDARVKILRKYERAFKKAYGVNVEVRFLEAKHAKSMFIDKEIRGYYSPKRKLAIVFLDNDGYKIKRTLFHELTHAYQHQKMSRKFAESRKLLREEKVTYEDSWHERHARHCAEILVNTEDYSFNLKYAENYELYKY